SRPRESNASDTGPLNAEAANSGTLVGSAKILNSKPGAMVTGSVCAMETVEKLVNAKRKTTSVTAQRARKRCDLNKTSTPLETAPSGRQTRNSLTLDQNTYSNAQFATVLGGCEGHVKWKQCVMRGYLRFAVHVASPISPRTAVPFMLSLDSIFPV